MRGWLRSWRLKSAPDSKVGLVSAMHAANLAAAEMQQQMQRRTTEDDDHQLALKLQDTRVMPRQPSEEEDRRYAEFLELCEREELLVEAIREREAALRRPLKSMDNSQLAAAVVAEVAQDSEAGLVAVQKAQRDQQAADTRLARERSRKKVEQVLAKVRAACTPQPVAFMMHRKPWPTSCCASSA